MQHVADISAPPLVEFVKCQMEFHEEGPQRPEGPIVMNLQSKDAEGNPLLQVFNV